jgi:arylsulfatase A-like enzyme
MDEVVGKLVKFEDKNTVTMIVTDHGQFLQGSHGIHRNNGFIILHGGPIRKHLMKQAKVLDITPTVLYLSGLPVAQDMDGSVLVEAIDPGYLQKNPVTYISSYDDHKNQKDKKEAVDREVNEENMEQLKALGYVSD